MREASRGRPPGSSPTFAASAQRLDGWPIGATARPAASRSGRAYGGRVVDALFDERRSDPSRVALGAAGADSAAKGRAMDVDAAIGAAAAWIVGLPG